MNAEDRALALSGEKSVFLNVAKYEQMQRVASMLAKTDFIPKQFQGNIGNCMIALDMAGLMGMHVLMLMRSMYVVHGMPGFEGKFFSALINNSKRYTDPLEYEWQGEQGKSSWGCRAYAKRRSTGKVIFGPWVTWEMVTREGWNKPKGSGPNQQQSKWVTMPELMFMYRAATFFGRVHDADLTMGMQTIEEIEDKAQDQMLYKQPDGSFSTLKPATGDNAGIYEPFQQAPTQQTEQVDSPTLPDQQEQPIASNVDDFGMPLLHPFAKKAWFAMRQGSFKDGTGFAYYIAANKENIVDITDAAFDAMEDKYIKLYGEPIPEDIVQYRSNSPVQEPIEETAKRAAPVNEIELLNTPAAKQLAEIAKQHRLEYMQVVQNKYPQSVQQIIDWIDQINQLVVDKKINADKQQGQD